jgi:hypothetical protein
MFRQGPVSVTLHSIAEPFFAALLIAAPFLFGFDDVGAPTALAIVAGVGLLVLAMSTCWRLSLMKLVPLPAHAMLDLAVGALLVASPFLFGFNDDSGAATAFFIVFGLLEIMASLATRWSSAAAPARRRRGGRGEEPPPVAGPAG